MKKKCLVVIPILGLIACACDESRGEVDTTVSVSKNALSQICEPLIESPEAFGSFYPDRGCGGQEYAHYSLGTWDGRGCVEDFNLMKCDDFLDTALSYRDTNGDCYNCSDSQGDLGKFCGCEFWKVYRSPVWGSECCNDSGCTNGEICCAGHCESGECCVDDDCTGSDHCVNNSCEECGRDGHCGGATPHCCSDNECAECCDDADCSAGKWCDSWTSTCEKKPAACDPTCTGRPCTTDRQCTNGGCPLGFCLRDRCMCVE